MTPLVFTWTDDGHMVPLQRFARQADKQFVIGEMYTMTVDEGRSQASHNHYFAAVHEAWANLPEATAERFPSAEHLRKWALIRAGFRDERTILASSPEQARQIAALAGSLDEFTVVDISDTHVTVYSAKSQSTRAMGAQEFQRSKQAVLDILAGMIGTTADELGKAAA